ncbi:MAG: ABC-2 family transporter protein [Anaerolineales bacterium]|nr:ABC-2 family transporter protein [Anaerolineales bacterium]
MNSLRWYVKLIRLFWGVSLQEEAAYRANFFINLLYSLLNLASGFLGVWVIFSQVETIGGWDFASTLALLGAYLTAAALHRLFISPSLDSLVGIDGDVWSGRLDFTLLRPLNTQFLASFRRWRIFSLFDLLLGAGVLAAAIIQIGQGLSAERLAAFLAALACGLLILYSLLLAFTALVFWSPGVLFTWVFNDIFQMARYPVHIYPGWLRLVLTWIIPVGLVTTLPAEALTGVLPPMMLVGSAAFALLLFLGASVLFRLGLRRYASASS